MKKQNVNQIKRDRIKFSIEKLKMSGIKCSRNVLYGLGKSFAEKNKDVLSEGALEMKVLSMKRFFGRKGWVFPPRIAEPTVADMINNYYGKKIVDYK